MEYLVCEPFINIWIAFPSKKAANAYRRQRVFLDDPDTSEWAKREGLDRLLATLPHRIRVLPMPIEITI